MQLIPEVWCDSPRQHILYSVRSEDDLVWETHPLGPAPETTLCIGVGPQSKRAHMGPFNGLRGLTRVGFIRTEVNNVVTRFVVYGF